MRLDDREANPFAAPESDLVTGVAQRSETNLTCAGFLARIGAIIVDFFIVLTPVAVTRLAYIGFDEQRAHKLREMEVPLLTLFYAAIWLYFAVQESSAAQATLGKRLLRIKVVDMYGQRISFLRATGRFLGKIVSYLLCFVGFLMQPFTTRRQAFHDILAGTLVIKD